MEPTPTPPLSSHKNTINNKKKIHYEMQSTDYPPTAVTVESACLFYRRWAQFDASRRGKKMLNASRDKNARHVPWWGGGGRAYYSTSPGISLVAENKQEQEGAKITNAEEE